LEYRSRKGAKDAPVVTRMKELSAQYPRYGYRRIRERGLDTGGAA
jgi:putative transposase